MPGRGYAETRDSVTGFQGRESRVNGGLGQGFLGLGVQRQGYRSWAPPDGRTSVYYTVYITSMPRISCKKHLRIAAHHF